MKLEIPVSIGELWDKITILEIKKNNAKGEKLFNIMKEYNELIRIAPEIKEEYLFELRYVNSRLWDIEDAIREKEHNDEFDSEFIALARNVYKTNDLRFEIKKKINIESGSYMIEEKLHKYK
jgi:hypothetical protein